MKTALSIILLFASVGNLIAQDAGATDITTMTPPTSSAFGSIDFTITAAGSPATGIPKDDIVILSKATAAANVVDTDPRFTIVTLIAADGTATIPIVIKSSGTYFVYVKRGGNLPVKQTGLQVVVTIAAPAADLVSSIDKTTAANNTDTTIVFTLKTTTSLPKYYQLVFSKEATPVSTDPAYELTTASAAATVSATLKFPADGTYSLFVVNEKATKQGSVSITIASSYLTVSLGVLLCMLLF